MLSRCPDALKHQGQGTAGRPFLAVHHEGGGGSAGGRAEPDRRWRACPWGRRERGVSWSDPRGRRCWRRRARRRGCVAGGPVDEPRAGRRGRRHQHRRREGPGDYERRPPSGRPGPPVPGTAETIRTDQPGLGFRPAGRSRARNAERGMRPEGHLVEAVLRWHPGARLRVVAVLGDQGQRRVRQRRRAELAPVTVSRGQMGQHRRRGRAPARIPLQARADHIGQLDRQPAEVRLVGGQLDQDVHHGVALVGGMAGGGVQHGGAERENIAGQRRLPGIPGLLGRHIGGGADRAAGHRQLDPLGGPGDPEVDDPRAIG